MTSLYISMVGEHCMFTVDTCFFLICVRHTFMTYAAAATSTDFKNTQTQCLV